MHAGLIIEAGIERLLALADPQTLAMMQSDLARYFGLAVAVVLTAVMASLIVPRKPALLPRSASPKPPQSLPKPQQAVWAQSGGVSIRERLETGHLGTGHDAIEALSVQRLADDKFNRAKKNLFQVVDISDRDEQGRAVIYVQNAVYVYPKEFSPDRTYRVHIFSARTGAFSVNLRIRPRVAAREFDDKDDGGPYLKVAFNADAASKYHQLNHLEGEVCEIRFDEALSPAQAAWLAVRGTHPDADINIGALFVLIGVPVTLISTLLCRWLDLMNTNMVITSAVYLTASLSTLLVVYIVRRHWNVFSKPR